MVWSIRTSLFIVSAYHYQKFINCPSPLAGYVGRLKVLLYKYIISTISLPKVDLHSFKLS